MLLTQGRAQYSEMFFKSIKDQAASKSDGNLDNKKGVAVPTITRQDELVEENTGFSSFPTIVRNSGSYTAFPVFKKLLGILPRLHLLLGV